MNHRRILFDCRGRSPSEILGELDREASDPPNGRRVVLLLNRLKDLEGRLTELLTGLVDYFHNRRMRASIVDPTGIANEAYRQLGGSMLVEVCRVESEVTTPLDILLVEDTADSLQFMRTLLTEIGHRVTCAPTGREALRFFEKGRYDLVLLDLVLPDMDGMTLASRFAENSVPVIAVSAHLDRWDTDTIERNRFKCVLPKPFRIPDLLEALRAG